MPLTVTEPAAHVDPQPARPGVVEVEPGVSAGHVAQEDEPAAEENDAAGHREHVVAPTREKDPGLHGVQEAEPELEKVPAGQRMHAPSEANVPAAQVVQVVAPVVVEMVPGEHATQPKEPPPAVPMAHGVHALPPLCANPVPAGHVLHVKAPSAVVKVFAAQGVHADWADSELEEPRGQGEQLVAPGWEKVPTGHALQVVALELAWKVPAGHSWELAVPARAVAGVGWQKEPGGQGVHAELPMKEAKVPVGQRLHEPKPCPAWNMPARHSWQVVPKGWGCMVPAGHTVQVRGGPAL